MTKILYRLSVVAGLMGIVLFGIVLALPFGKTAEALSQLGNIFVILWIAAIYFYQRDSFGWLGRLGFVALLIGGLCVLLQNYLFFVVWKFDLKTIEAQLNTPVMFLFLAVRPILAWAIMALGTASLETGKLPRGSTILWLVGVLLFMIMPTYPTLAATAAGGLWIGFTMWKGSDHRADQAGAMEETGKTGEVANHTPDVGRRLLSLDATRGLIMALMAIDHASLLIRKAHSFEIFDMPIPTYTEAAAFLTRFVTHICAPGFFFLMGAGMILLSESRQAQGWSWWRIARHLLARGLLLIALEQLLLDPVLYQRVIFTEFGVLFGLGSAMIFGILFLRLGTLPLLGIGAGLILITQVLPEAMTNLGTGYPPLVRLFLLPGQTGDWFVIYPTIPWLGIATLGMAFGREFLKDRKRVYRKALIAGLVFLALFIVVRSLGGFGNFIPPAGTGWIDFLNMVKYPPSLGFTLYALGSILLLTVLFAWLGERLAKWGRPLLVFGQTALFFYFMHWFLLYNISPLFPKGTSLLVMYVCWALVLALLYPICKSYMTFKRETAPESVWRLF